MAAEPGPDDAIWVDAPLPALRVPAAGGMPRANAAALSWAAQHGADAAALQALALEVLAAEQPLARTRLHGGPMVAVTRVELADGCLLWLQPQPEAEPQRLAQVLDRALVLAGVSVWRIDLATRRIHFNAVGWNQIAHPRSAEGVPLELVRATVHPGDLGRIAAAAEEALRSDAVVDCTARYRNPDGSWRTLLTRRVAERDAAGHPVGLSGISIDLSRDMAERERAEQLAERTRLAAEALGLGFWTRNLDTGETHWNEQLYALYGRDPALPPPTLKEWLDGYVHADDRERVRGLVRASDAAWRSADQIEFRAVDRDGQPRWVQSWARRVRHGEHSQVIVMQLDVTALRLQQQQQQRERLRAQFALDASGVGVWERDADGRLVYWNAQMYRQRGLAPDDPRPVEELAALCTVDEDLARLRELFVAHLRDGTPYQATVRVRLPDGAERQLLTQGQAVYDEAGRVLGMVGLHLDVTDRLRVEAAQREAQRVEQLQRDRSAFLRRISHELRTPMNAILGFARLLRDDAGEPPSARQHERLSRIDEAGVRLLALIDDLLELTRADVAPVGQLAARRQVGLQALLAQAADQAGAALRAAGVAWQAPAADATLALDGARGAGALSRLLAFAAARAPRAARLAPRVVLHAQTLDLVLEVPGDALAPEWRQRVFEPFAPLPGSGDGVGLALARHSLQTLGVRVEARCDADGRLAFELTLPLVPAAVPGARARDVLCIEDNPANLQLVRELMALRPQVRLRTAETGGAGIAQARQQLPDLVLLDLQLPDISGMEVLQRLRADPATAGCRIVALSADAMPEHIRDALAAGFDHYLTKPIHFDAFLAEIDRPLDRV